MTTSLHQSHRFKKWQEVEAFHGNRLHALLKYSLDTHNFLAFSNIAKLIGEWVFQTTFILYSLKNWNYTSLTVTGERDAKELNILEKEATRVDKVIETYEMSSHWENLVNAYALKYEILMFINKIDEAKIVASQMSDLIEKYEMNAFRSKYLSLIDGDLRHDKFINNFTNHMTNIFRIMKNSGSEKYMFQKIPPDILATIDPVGSKLKWVEGNFYDIVLHVP